MNLHIATAGQINDNSKLESKLLSHMTGGEYPKVSICYAENMDWRTNFKESRLKQTSY